MIATAIITIFISFIAGKGEALRIKNDKLYSEKWHTNRWFERVGLLAIGLSIVDVYSILLAGIIFWIIYDACINKIALNKNIFYISKTSKAWTEKFGYLKLPLLIGILWISLIK